MREAVGLIARFGLAGLVNTAVGFGVVVVLDPVLGVAPALANAAAYAVGMAVSFMLNRSFVFRSQSGLSASGLRYLVAAAGAFVLNQIVLHVAGALLGAGAALRLTAQLMGMATYTVAMFTLCRAWVFRMPIRAPAA
ncbi:MAG TPA: GtrA family protein [Caulobacteraceae bacterium]|jgi:putative flippase GtrA|nr:GtrA family protein [Caulobacteraceae bacterium]